MNALEVRRLARPASIAPDDLTGECVVTEDLVAEDLHVVAGLRIDVNDDGAMRREAASSEKPKEPFPGAVPTDGKLQGLLRSFIRPTNDDATVDKVLADVKEHIKDNADLRQQAIDGWTRILHFGDRYGTEYARKVGQEFLDELKRRSK